MHDSQHDERGDAESQTEYERVPIGDDEEFAVVDADGNVVDTPESVPDWDDEYLDRVSDRLMFNYDLDRDFTVQGRTFPMYGQLRIETKKDFFTSAIQYGHHESFEHLFVTRSDDVSVADLEPLVDLGNDLADEWIEPNEEHYKTDFTFVVVASDLPDAVVDFVRSFSERTLLKYGFHGSYEVHLAVVDPDRESVVASQNTDIDAAFRLWAPIEPRQGMLDRFRKWFSPLG